MIVEEKRMVDSPGMIALPTNEIGRFVLNTICIAGTQQPPNCYLNAMASASVTQNLNSIIAQMRDVDEWLWVLGDDHAWESGCLMKMLAILDEHPEIDILVPLVTKRNPPWHLVLFKEVLEKPEDNVERWKPLEWSEIPDSGVFEVDSAGSAGMLIRRKVLNEMGYPWFESSGGVILNEDVYFCLKARRAGARIFATADMTMGHIGIFNVRPVRKNDRWGALTEFASPEEQYRQVFMPDVEQAYDLTVNGR